MGPEGGHLLMGLYIHNIPPRQYDVKEIWCSCNVGHVQCFFPALHCFGNKSFKHLQREMNVTSSHVTCALRYRRRSHIQARQACAVLRRRAVLVKQILLHLYWCPRRCCESGGEDVRFRVLLVEPVVWDTFQNMYRIHNQERSSRWVCRIREHYPKGLLQREPLHRFPLNITIVTVCCH